MNQMKKVSKLWLMFGLVAGILISCSQDKIEPSSTAYVSEEAISVSLNAEVSLDDPNLRAIDYRLGNNSSGELVPMPQFVDKQEVEVHTILKSSNGVAVAKTLKWRYDASKRKLVLKQNDGHSISVTGFNNDGGVRWYVSGLIGGTLIDGTTRVVFAGERVLRSVDGNVGDLVGSLNVPYAFGWTELTIDASLARDADGSHKYAAVPQGVSVKFSPRGALVAYKLGNAQDSGSYTFSPKGFIVGTNTWGDQGEFELSTDIPTAHPEKAMPIWTESSCASTMHYTFASGHTPSAIAHNSTTDKTYYAWVIPHKEQPATAQVRVMLQGKSSRPETTSYKDYTETYFTDYAPKTTGTQGRVSHGKVHTLAAKAKRRVMLPIEYVAEYNLAGGNGLTYTTTNFTSPQPAGVQGGLRFANSHSNDQSGYYNWYEVAGQQHATYNPSTRNLQAEVDNTFGSGNYLIPTIEQLWGIYPSAFTWTLTLSAPSPRLNSREAMAVGLGADMLRQTYLSDYSRAFTSPHGGSDVTDNAVLYAIRFKARTNDCTPLQFASNYDTATGVNTPYTYPSALDNTMKCAYRFTRVGGANAWSNNNNSNLTNQFVIDVVYLGEEATPTTLDQISDEQWWSDKKSAGLLFSRTFPATGYVIDHLSSTSGVLQERGNFSYTWSSGAFSKSHGWAVRANPSQIFGGSGLTQYSAMPVRLFLRHSY